MTTSPTGFLLLLAGVLLLWLAPRWLPASTVFFVPFTATAVLVYRGGGSDHWLPAVNWFLLCWATSRVPTFLRTGAVRIPSGARMPLLTFSAFVGFAALSLLMPIWIDGRTSILATSLLTSESGISYPLRFSMHQLLVGADLGYGVLVTMLVAADASGRNRYDALLRAVFASALFISGWGLFEYMLSTFSLPYPAFLFNDNPTEGVAALGARFFRTGDQAVRRIRSVGLEPSILAQSLLAVLPIVACAAWGDRPVWSRRLDRITLAAGIVCLVLSGSGSGLLGLAFMLLAVFQSLPGRRQLGATPYVALILALVAMGTSYALSTTVRDYVDLFVVQKPLSDSGLERAFVTLNAWDYFKEYPILGLGWGSVPSADLVVLLLSNIGIVGFGAFTIFLVVLWRALGRTARSLAPKDADGRLRIAGVRAAIATTIFVAAISRFTYEHAHVWLVFGLALAALTLGQTRTPGHHS